MRKENTHSATAATASMDVSDIVFAEILSLLKIHMQRWYEYLKSQIHV